MSALAVRKKIVDIEEHLLKMPQVEIKTTHFISDGLYGREIFIPKGTILTGAIHNFEHINVVSKGEIIVATENGRKRIKAPATFISPPGTKRIGITLEDTIWTTFHANPTNETEIEKLEEKLVRENYTEEELALCESEVAEILKEVVCPTLLPA